MLYARSNRIADVGGAAALVNLQSLDLECNALATLSALTPLWSCGALNELRLRGNLLPYAGYRRAGVANLPLLKSLDGADIHADTDGVEEEDGATTAEYLTSIPQTRPAPTPSTSSR